MVPLIMAINLASPFCPDSVEVLASATIVSAAVIDDYEHICLSAADERVEWIKPIMFSGGIGTIDAAFVQKNKPQEGMCVVKVGGPVYRFDPCPHKSLR